MNYYAKIVREKLMSVITSMSENFKDFAKNPLKDFSGNRKIPFKTLIEFILSMGGNTLSYELLELTDYSVDAATSSAFVQQRDKLSNGTFQYLFRKFTDSLDHIKLYNGYRLLADDGSVLSTPYNPNDLSTFQPSGTDARGSNSVHVNAVYDLINNLFVDALIQTSSERNEKKALIDMIERLNISDPVILTMDRGFEGYNILTACSENNINYVCRVKDIDSNGIIAGLGLSLPDVFDLNRNFRANQVHIKTTWVCT